MRVKQVGRKYRVEYALAPTPPVMVKHPEHSMSTRRSAFMSTRRSAFTIVEVLVVLLLVGLLLALLLPAVQAARESARRAQCASNLRQVALAVQVYEQTHQRLPALYSGPYGAEVAGIEAFYLHSWQSLILPQLEETNLYRQIDFSKLATDVDNGPAIATWLPVYVCPSATRSQDILDGIRCEVPPWAARAVTTAAMRDRIRRRHRLPGDRRRGLGAKTRATHHEYGAFRRLGRAAG